MIESIQNFTELNAYLQANSSLLNIAATPVQDGYTFDYATERGAVTATQIQSQTFKSGSNGITDSTSHNTNSGSLVDMPFTASTVSTVGTQSALLVFSGELAAVHAGTAIGEGLEAYIYVGGDIGAVQEPRITFSGGAYHGTVTGPQALTLTTHKLVALSAATTYEFKVQWRVINGASIASVNNRELSYYLL